METQLPLPQRGSGPRIFGPYLLQPNGSMNQDVTWYGDRLLLGQGDFVLDGDRSPSPKGVAEPPHFRPMFIVAKRLGG